MQTSLFSFQKSPPLTAYKKIGKGKIIAVIVLYLIEAVMIFYIELISPYR